MRGDFAETERLDVLATGGFQADRELLLDTYTNADHLVLRVESGEQPVTA